MISRRLNYPGFAALKLDKLSIKPALATAMLGAAILPRAVIPSDIMFTARSWLRISIPGVGSNPWGQPFAFRYLLSFLRFSNGDLRALWHSDGLGRLAGVTIAITVSSE